MAPKQLDVAALGVRGEDSLRSTLEAVEFAGNQRLQGKLIVLELGNLYLETLFFCEIAGRHHEENTGVGLGIDQAMLPKLFLRISLS